VSAIYYDPYDFEIDANPHPVWRRMRDEAPLYRNDKHDFWALSRFDDVEAGLLDWRSYSSARGSVLEIIKAGITIPPGVILFEDPPIHDVHRSVLARAFTPRRMAAIEPQVRAFCARSLDPLVGSGGFDFIADLGSQMPMRVIGMLLGIPEEDQEAIRDNIDESLRLEEGQPTDANLRRASQNSAAGALSAGNFPEYIAWRRKHPSDDLMTELLGAVFVDDIGVERRLRDEELLALIGLLAGAGNETTTRLIGWTGFLLDRFPDQRRLVVADRSLVPNAIEEILRFEPSSTQAARYVGTDVEMHGQTIPAGSAFLCLIGSANRDEREFEDPDRFDIHRKIVHHLTFAYGAHFCLGAALARLEGRVALDELLDHFSEWDVDLEQAQLGSSPGVRGYASLPVHIP